jgi:hypothetical protein
MNFEDIHNQIEEAKHDWIKDNRDIKGRVFEILDRQKSNLIAKLLGFNARYGDNNWEVDHCNGRQRDTFIGRLIETIGEQHAKEWVTNQFENLESQIGLPQEALDSIIKNANNRFQYNLKQRLQEMAEKLANEYATKLMPSITGINVALSNEMLDMVEPTSTSLNSMLNILKNFDDKCDAITVTEEKLQSWLFRSLNGDAELDIIKDITQRYNDIMKKQGKENE